VRSPRCPGPPTGVARPRPPLAMHPYIRGQSIALTNILPRKAGPFAEPPEDYQITRTGNGVGPLRRLSPDIREPPNRPEVNADS